ncbi:envelope integrity protein Cei [Allokutzneria sp. A3M-2-11 16]|uniref:envelope integrity protein Cei n=1 Tax=Allokutzneria sp. A3M-2-11 16 TaxID=2962043 RepID=UPI0020B6CBAD|nr:envelope integrity protein Cei [Allokutzneria sp. A3M-2-11 16]MCP3804499.1 envelope integrity protein Cei [Allokutzneria sp. A3M-2-11 16]
MRQIIGPAGYRKRKPVPALILLAILGVLAVSVWTKVFSTSADVEAAVRCPDPGAARPGASAAPAKLGQALPLDALDRTDPIAPNDMKVTVLNGSGRRGLAGQVAEKLAELGFNKAGEPSDDPVYVNQDLDCRGQIRFGPNGASAARTMSFLLPCAQFIRDDRQDGGIDVALGRKFTGVDPSSEAKQIFEQLKTWSEQQPESGGQQAAPAPPSLDSALVKAARTAYC